MPTSRKFTVDDLEIACGELATIPYFPSAERAFVMNLLRKMCPHYEALRFVVDTAVARCKQWPGMSELRGLLCSRFDAADGLDEPNCSIPGFTAEEAEARYLAHHESVKAQSQLPVANPIIRQLTDGKPLELPKAKPPKRAEFAYSPEQMAQLEADVRNENLPYAARKLAADMLTKSRQAVAEAKA